MRKIFKDPLLQNQFEEDGYLAIDFVEPELLDKVNEAYEQLSPNDNFIPQYGTYHVTCMDTNKDYKVQANKLLTDAFEARINELLIDYSILVTNFITKPKNAGEIEVHANWSTVDETKFTSLNAWIPLQDTNEINGTLEVVPGSNKISLNITCFNEPYLFANFEETLKEKYFKRLNTQKGQMVIFDDNLLHYSKKNNSDLPRKAIQLICVPNEAETIVYYKDLLDKNYFNVFEINKEFYLTNTLHEFVDGNPPLKKINRVPNNNQLLTEAQFATLLTKGKAWRKKLFSQDKITADQVIEPIKENQLKRLFQKLF